MWNGIHDFFDSQGLTPHGFCLLWRPQILWSDVVSDSLIALSYFSIPAVLFLFAWRRPDFHAKELSGLFASFIVLCGITHVFATVTLWYPLYGPEAAIKAATAVASVMTAVSLWRMLPRLMLLPSVQQLSVANDRLSREIVDRGAAELALKNLNAELDARVRSRTAELESVNQALERSEKLFRELMESAPNAMIMVGREGVIELVNVQVETIFGYDRAELIGEPIDILLPDNFRQRYPEYRRAFLENLDPRGIGIGMPPHCRRKNGTEFPVEIELNPITTPAGPKILSAIVDISDRVEAEMRQQQYVGDLKRINEELNSFAYVASHDLKSPMRGIDQLASWIAEDLGDSLSPQTRNHLRLLRSRISRMEMLLDDLLAYSRVGRTEDEIVTVDTGALVNELFEMMHSGRHVRLEISQDMPVLKTKKVPLEMVFRNLIGNAIKHNDKPEAWISVSARDHPEGIEFVIADNGPGIAPEHHGRVFGMFQTLRPRDEMESSGIGLALVKKAVELAGGTVALESDGATGCMFRFVWPSVQEDAKLP